VDVEKSPKKRELFSTKKGTHRAFSASSERESKSFLDRRPQKKKGDCYLSPLEQKKEGARMYLARRKPGREKEEKRGWFEASTDPETIPRC